MLRNVSILLISLTCLLATSGENIKADEFSRADMEHVIVIAGNMDVEHQIGENLLPVVELNQIPDEVIDGREEYYQALVMAGLVFMGEETSENVRMIESLDQVIQVSSLAVVGTNNNDILYGTSANETFYGYDGNDTMYPGGGYDRCYGGKGNDTYIYNKGDWRLYIYEMHAGGSDTLRISWPGLSRLNFMRNDYDDSLTIKFDGGYNDFVAIRNHYDPAKNAAIETLIVNGRLIPIPNDDANVNL